MRRITLLSCFGLALLSVLVSPPLVRGQARAAPPPEPRYLFCIGAASPQSTIYYSGTIVTTEKDLNPVHVAFFQFLKQKYSYKGPGDYPGDLQCTGVRTLEEARSFEQIYVNRDRQQKRTVVETGWTYNGALAPIAASPPAAPTAAGVGMPPPAPQGQDPRLAQVPEPFRRQMLDEMPNTRGYCQNNVLLSELLDCACFSKAVLDYRIAHAKEYHVPRGGHDTGGWEPISTLPAVVDCSACISDDRILNWAAARALKSLSPDFSDADKKSRTECISRSFLANFRAKPYVGLEREHWFQAVESCRKQ